MYQATEQDKETAKIGAVKLFGEKFDSELVRRLAPDLEPTKTIGDLMVDAVSELLKDSFYKDVLDYYLDQHEATYGYQENCKKALDLYLAKKAIDSA